MRATISLLVLLMAALVAIQVPTVAQATPTVTVSPVSGPPGTPVTVSAQGLDPGATYTVEWWTVEGNRVSGVGYTPVAWELGTATADAMGSLTYSFESPEDLGGRMTHPIKLVSGDVVVAETEFELERHMTLTPLSGPEGTMMHFEMVGGGWTQLDNIVAITYDNAFIGYACSFTNQGHISVWIQAVGAVGVHQIGIYPAIYSGPRSWNPTSNPEPFKHPVLNTDDIYTIYEPEFFYFEITESSQAGVSRLGGAVNIYENTDAGDTLVIPFIDPVLTGGSGPEIAVGNGAQGIVGGVIPYAIANFPPNTQVDFRWDTRDAVMKMGGDLGDQNLGWIFTETYAQLGSVQTDAMGAASGTLTIPEDFGDDHFLEALVDGQPVANTTFKVIGRFTATLSEDGTEILLRGTGLGWTKYTANYNVLYDGAAMGFISALTSRGTAEVSIPVVGVAGLHTVEVFGGQSGYPFLNKHETSWPWERVYRFAFTIEGLDTEPQPGPLSQASLPLWIGAPLIVAMGAIGLMAGRLWRARDAKGEA